MMTSKSPAVVAFDEDALERLEGRLGHSFRERDLLRRALTHASWANEQPGPEGSRDNETLEFLGDAVLNLLVAEQLFETYPAFREGMLSKARSHLVSESSFAARARTLGLGELLRLSDSEARGGGRLRDSILSDAFEAVFAALYLDAGVERTRLVARGLFAADIAAIDPGELTFHDYKTALQEVLQAQGEPLPSYSLVSESGPDHAKSFVCEVRFAGNRTARGEGRTKKQAQRQAAKNALAELEQD